jgi:hypothetical protein
MDMKKILQAFDGVAEKPKVESDDMKKFISIIREGKGPLNRPTAAESIAMQHYAEPAKKSITTPTLNVAVGAKPSMIGKYFKTVSEEFNATADQSKTRARQLAERVIERIVPGQEPAPGINRLTGKPVEPTAPAAPTAPAGPRGTNLKMSVLQQLKAGTYKGFAPKLSPEELDAAIAYKQQAGDVNEELNPPDAVTVDIPLLLRLLEYAKEDAKTDMDLHNVTEKLIQMSGEGETLSMKDYDAIVGDQLALPAPDENNDGEEDY